MRPHLTVAKPSDLVAIQGLNHALCSNEHDRYDATVETTFPFTQEGAKYFRDKITDAHSLVLIAKVNEQPIGYLVGGVVDTESYRIPIKLAELENMYVQEPYQNQGTGQMLFTMFEDWCTKQSINRIKIVASASNRQAISFYTKQGAKPINLTLEKQITPNSV